jgi:hypothetical protein
MRHLHSAGVSDMDDKPKDSGKLKLRNTDTNRFKVDTGRLRVQPTPGVPREADKQGAGETQQSNTFVDPISLRDTSTSKLKRLDGPGAVGTTVVPASAASEKKSETVRLKVVRATPRPGTLPPSAAPLANVPLSVPAEAEKKEDTAPQAAETPSATPILTVPQIKLPPQAEAPESIKPGATTNIAAEYPQEPIVGDQVPPSAAKISLRVPTPAVETPKTEQPTPDSEVAKPAAPTPQELSTDTASLQKTPPSKATAEAIPSSTIKLSIKKPTGAPLPTPGGSQPSAPVAEAQPQPAAPAPPKLPSTATTGLKIRPSATSGGTVVAPAPVADGGQTARIEAPPAASATVKVSPAALMPPSTGAKISLKKEAVEPVAAPEAAAPASPAESAQPTPSSSTVAVKAPTPESSAGGTGKGLRLSGKAGKTVSVPAPGAAAKKPDGEQAAVTSDKPSEAQAAPALTPGHLPVAGISKLEAVSALVATVALAVTLFSLVMSLLKQL